MDTHPIQARTIITTHNNADFDGIASMVAAQKLYDNAVIVAPTLFSRAKKTDFVNAIPRLFNFVDAKDCDFSCVDCVVLVDTKDPKRLVHIQELLHKEGLSIHVYDHHPIRASDVKADLVHIQQAGSTVSILLSLIQEKNIALSADEATLFALGLYEDTGFFTHASTRAQDFLLGAFLHEQGMRLDEVKNLASDITGDDIHLLDTLLRNQELHNVQGTEFIISELSSDEFTPELSSVVAKLLVVEPNIQSIFVIALMEDKIHLIARSKNNLIDVGKICAHFGGGGHAQAASATIKGQTIPEVKGLLSAYLLSCINTQLTVSTHMTSPAVTIDDTSSLIEANNLMIRYGFKALPILSHLTKECVGILSLELSAKALGHGLGNNSVSSIMQRTFVSLQAHNLFEDAVNIIVKQRQRLIPVVEDKQLIGVVTRTDILKLLLEHSSLVSEESEHLDQKDLGQYLERLLQERLTQEDYSLLKEISTLADEVGMNVYLVGGMVRDLLLHQDTYDLDICVEGKAEEFALLLSKRVQGKYVIHKKFDTATVIFSNKHGKKQSIDIATARLEYYDKPGALPEVELSSIKLDLLRRDFTINAMALQINRQYFANLIDPFGGQNDLENGVIAVLHSLSFIEDPTRIFRAVRFEKRFSFTMNLQTERLIKSSLQLDSIKNLSGTRIYNELLSIFKEKNSLQCLSRLDDLQVLEDIHPLLELTLHKKEILEEMDLVLTWFFTQFSAEDFSRWKSYFLVFMTNAKYQDASSLLIRMGFLDAERKKFLHLREVCKQVGQNLHDENYKKQKASELYQMLRYLPEEVLVYLMAQYKNNSNIAQRIRYFLSELANKKITITGDDLIDLGYRPSPLFGTTLEYVLMKYLDGEVGGFDEQLALAKQFLEEKSNKEELQI